MELKWLFIAGAICMAAICAWGAVDSWASSRTATACVQAGGAWDGSGSGKCTPAGR